MRRSEIVGFDCAAAQTLDGGGWFWRKARW
jgi:hypothetical protein